MDNIWSIKIIDIMYINAGEVLCVKAIDEISKAHHLYIWAPQFDYRNMPSEKAQVKHVINRWHKFVWEEIKPLLTWLSNWNDVRIPIPTKRK